MPSHLLLGPPAVTPFVPTDIGGDVLWLRAENIAGSDGDAVGTWSDLSGNGNNATQATAAKKPTLKRNILNGLSVVRFASASSQFMSIALALTQPDTVYVVGKAGGASQKFFDGDNASRRHAVGTSATNFIINAGTPLGNGTADTSWHILGGVFNGASSVIDRDGTEVTGNANTQNPNALVIGAAINGTTDFLNGDIAEVIVYASALGASDRQRVRHYLAARYAITTTL